MKEFSNNRKKLEGYDARSTPLGNVKLPSFDALMVLARERPDELEAMRQDLCREIIASAPNRIKDRLEGLQFQINMERRLSKSAVGACVRISSMMNDSLQELKQVLTEPNEYLQSKTTRSADIIPIHRVKSS